MDLRLKTLNFIKPDSDKFSTEKTQITSILSPSLSNKPPRKKPTKRISFSSLNADNTSSNGTNINSNTTPINHNNRVGKALAKSVINADISNLQTNTSSSSNFHLPSFFLDERNSSISSKIDIHRKIMDIGENLHESIVNSIRKEYESKIKLKEIEINEMYSRQKEEQVEHERLKFAAKLESIKNQLKNDYDRLLKEKTVEIEIYNQNIAKEQIELNKQEAKKTLEETVAKLKQRFENEKKDAVEKAIAKEKILASSSLDEQRKIYEAKLNDLNENWANKMHTNLHDLRVNLNKDYEKVILNNCEQVRVEKNGELEKLREEYENKLDRNKVDYQIKVEEITQLNLKLNSLQEENEQLRVFINELRQEFQNCIEHFSHLKKKEADFLFPITDNLKKKFQM